MRFIDPHIHMSARTTDDYERMGDARVGTLRFEIFWAGIDPSPAAGDTDWTGPDAVVANAARNGIEGGIRALEGSLPTDEAPFGVVLANLIAGVLVPLAPQLRAELADGGALVASGIFVDREAEVADAFVSAGLAITRRDADGDWIALEATPA